MFPSGFIDWGDKPCKIIVSCPFIEKMHQYPGNQRKDSESNLCVGKLFLEIFHHFFHLRKQYMEEAGKL